MAEIVNSLFGTSPESYLSERNRRDYLDTLAVARQSAMPGTMMSPSLAPFYQQAAQEGQLIGRGVGAIAGMFGVEDPELVKLRDVAELRKGFDLNTPTGVREYAQALNKKGYADFALAANKIADNMVTTQLNQQKTIAETVAKGREKLPTIGQLQAYREQLIAAVGPNDPRVKEVDAVIKAEGEGKGTKIVLPGEAQDKILREKRTGKFLDLEDAAISAADTIQITRDFNNVLGKAFTGTGAGVKLTAAQFANALGVNVTGTTESEQLDQLFAALTVGQAKNLKGALSDKDVKFLKEAVGSRGLTKETLQNVVERIERNALIDQRTFELAQGYTGDMAKININDFRKQAQKDVNDIFEKRKRRDELRRKAGPQSQ
jgi:hypothetical protein